MLLKVGLRCQHRCAHGSTSLETFHHHLLSFIPGTSANAVNFQVYLLDGLSRWNALRKDAVDSAVSGIKLVRCFDIELMHNFNRCIFRCAAHHSSSNK